MNIEGASTLVHEEAPPSVNSSATTTIQSIKNLNTIKNNFSCCNPNK